MSPEELNFQAFFTARIKERGFSLKKISEATGIAPGYLESIAHGNFDNLPSAPYVHGYLIRLGKVLDFDGDFWWEKINKEGLVRHSGPTDALPNNRFMKQSPTKLIWTGIIVVIVIIYLAFQLPIIFSKPTITITFPAQNPYNSSSSTLTIQGTVRDADSLYLKGLNGTQEVVNVAPDGSWQKTVLLEDGLNTFDVSAKKLLGGERDVLEQIFYESPVVAASSTNATSTPSSTPF